MNEKSKPSSLQGIGKVIPAILLMFVVIAVGLGGMRYLKSLKRSPFQVVPAGSPATDVIVITLRDNGDIVLNGKEITMTQLETRMKKIVTAFPDQAVIIRAGENTEFKHVTEILDKLKEVGVWNAAFATKK